MCTGEQGSRDYFGTPTGLVAIVASLSSIMDFSSRQYLTRAKTYYTGSLLELCNPTLKLLKRQSLDCLTRMSSSNIGF